MSLRHLSGLQVLGGEQKPWGKWARSVWLCESQGCARGAHKVEPMKGRETGREDTISEGHREMGGESPESGGYGQKHQDQTKGKKTPARLHYEPPGWLGGSSQISGGWERTWGWNGCERILGNSENSNVRRGHPFKLGGKEDESRPTFLWNSFPKHPGSTILNLCGFRFAICLRVLLPTVLWWTGCETIVGSHAFQSAYLCDILLFSWFTPAYWNFALLHCPHHSTDGTLQASVFPSRDPFSAVTCLLHSEILRPLCNLRAHFQGRGFSKTPLGKSAFDGSLKFKVWEWGFSIRNQKIPVKEALLRGRETVAFLDLKKEQGKCLCLPREAFCQVKITRIFITIALSSQDCFAGPSDCLLVPCRKSWKRWTQILTWCFLRKQKGKSKLMRTQDKINSATRRVWQTQPRRRETWRGCYFS